MAKFILTYSALKDLNEIWNYTCDNWSEQQADLYYTLIITTCQKLAENPILGKKYEKVNRELFSYKAGEHLIFFRIINQTEIEVIRFLHSKMDLKSHL
ncbi:MAG: type II toxin-antitoxin system RelE/ParE family toxin [Chitinophagia bacterium]|jgi:toxin ParE1/3/4|nr:type II toxin-antitoxin system RelE/ParE family toxin [Bacteroidota bacterium]NDF99096.1 type II toxin-antitoxin system RelE/ParE family toxin [Chitinophagia bacterium]